MATNKNKSYRSFGSVRPVGKKFQASYKWRGKTLYGPHSFHFKTEANEWLALQQAALLNGETPKSLENRVNVNQLTITEYAYRHIDIQMTSKGVPLAASTKAKYSSYVKTHLSPLGDKFVSDLSPADVSDWYARLLKKGHVTTASKAYKLLHCIMNRAIDEELIALNPCKIKGAQNATSGAPIYTPTREEVVALMAAVSERYRALVHLSVVAALRFGEATALKVADVKAITAVATPEYFLDINKSVSRIDGGFVTGTTKSAAGNRLTPLAIETVTALKTHIEKFCPNDEPEALLFPSATGQHIHNGVFAKELSNAQKRAGLPTSGFGPHALRRAGATFLSEGGAHLDEVKDFLGDSTHKAALCYVKNTNRMPSLIVTMTNELRDTL